ncbi:MAG TPA: sigma-70 family RNA polymerase sigma factor [Chitinophagales bacterium]|nr:sigma-70 family RNA polymerase sigma factor [Chitinophagales bacterium]
MKEYPTLNSMPMTAENRAFSVAQTVKDYSKRLMGFIRKQVNNEADAEDILQDVFYQLANYAQPIEQLTAWLFTVARNKITDRRRKIQPDLTDFSTESDNMEDEDFVGDWKDLLLAPDNNPETDLLRSLFWDELNAALNELPAAQREVFVLNELEDIPFKTIAEQTGETVNTLLSRKRYAVLHLRKKLTTLRNELLTY